MNCEICGKNEDERNITEQFGISLCISCDGKYSDEELQNIKPSFEHNGIHITDSSMDESGRFEVNPIEYYGAKAFPDMVESNE